VLAAEHALIPPGLSRAGALVVLDLQGAMSFGDDSSTDRAEPIERGGRSTDWLKNCESAVALRRALVPTS
jgi:hypothetical protein